jgi:hypothetical protein
VSGQSYSCPHVSNFGHIFVKVFDKFRRVGLYELVREGLKLAAHALVLAAMSTRERESLSAL